MPFIPGETITTSTGMYSISKKPKMGYNAVVAGSFEYEVEIAVDENGIILDAYCTCLHAEKGNYCKLEVAVAFARKALADYPFHLTLMDELKKPVPDLQSISSFHESIILSFDEKLIPSK